MTDNTGRSFPRIVGDGVHDDTAGLRAAINGEPFICENQIVRAEKGTVCFGAGTFRAAPSPNEAREKEEDDAMTDNTRRSFLKGLLTVAAISCVPATVEAALSLPRIVGDGVHDDYAGLQAALNGEPFVCENQVVTAEKGAVTIRGGNFYLSRGLVLDCAKTEADVRECRFKFADGVKTGIAFHNTTADTLFMANCVTTMSGRS